MSNKATDKEQKQETKSEEQKTKSTENKEDNTKKEKQQATEEQEEQEEQKAQEKEEERSEEEKLRDELAEEKNKFMRLFAEFENYKRRTSKERVELFKTASQELMQALLPVLDDFDRALGELKKEKDEEVLTGVNLINDKFRKTLKQKGLEPMKVKEGDKFDADLHQAVTQIKAPKKKLKGKIVDVVETGYTLGEKIIRFPKVVTGK